MVTEKEQPADMGVLVWFFIGLYSNILSNAPPNTHTHNIGALLAFNDEIWGLWNTVSMISAHVRARVFHHPAILVLSLLLPAFQIF